MREFDLLVIGNGYDIALGYKTRYDDFLLSIKEAINTNNYDNYSDYMFNTQKIEINQNYYDLCVLNKNNYFIKYLLNRNEALNNWSDVETEIAHILQMFDSCFDNIKTFEGQRFVFDARKIENESIFEIISNNTWEKISCLPYKTSMYLLVDLNCSCLDNTNYYYDRIEEFKKKLVGLLYKDFTAIKELLCEYLKIASNNKTKKEMYDTTIKRIISYNYTKIAQSEFNMNENSMNYIHGNIDRGIVLGIDPSVRFNYDSFRRFNKSIQRLPLNNYNKSLHNTINMSNTIVYMGLSFDNNDYSSLSVLLLSPNAHHIVLYKDNDDLYEKGINIEKILGSDKFSEMINKKQIVFVESSSYFVDK